MKAAGAFALTGRPPKKSTPPAASSTRQIATFKPGVPSRIVIADHQEGRRRAGGPAIASAGGRDCRFFEPRADTPSHTSKPHSLAPRSSPENSTNFTHHSPSSYQTSTPSLSHSLTWRRPRRDQAGAAPVGRALALHTSPRARRCTFPCGRRRPYNL